jgi:hypothetical protein
MITRRFIQRAKMLAFLEELEEAPAGGIRSLYLPHEEVENTLPVMPTELAAPAAKSPTGAVLFQGHDVSYLILPPFPITEKSTTPEFFTRPLSSLLQRDYMIALVLVRLGAYAIGISQGDDIVSSKVGTGNIHGRHRQGGSSAHRFERHRDKQIEYFFTRVCQHAREQLEPQARSLDYIVYGGARTTLQLLLKQCSFLERLATPALPPMLDIPEPRRATLETSLRRLCSSTVLEWRED